MNEATRMIVVLTVISAASALLLAATNNLTREPIAKALKAEQLDALRQVLPPYDNQPDSDLVTIESGGVVWTACVARAKGEFVGCALSTSSEAGYSGRITLLVGLRPDGAVHGLRTLQQTETPGLGAKIASATDPFMSQFTGKSLASASWKTAKDGGDFDAITGATITSRAVIDAVQRALAAFQEGRARIAGVAASPQEEH